MSRMVLQWSARRHQPKP